MATLDENIKQAISDFDDVQAALEESGVEVPYGTATSEYGNLVRKAVALARSDGADTNEPEPKPETIIDKIISNEIPMLSGSEYGVNATTFAYISFTAEEAATAPTTSGFYQIVNNGVVSESGYQLMTESTGRSNYAIALPEGSTLVDIKMWDGAWVDYSHVFTETGTTTVGDYTYIIYTSANSSSGEILRFIIE